MRAGSCEGGPGNGGSVGEGDGRSVGRAAGTRAAALIVGVESSYV